MVSVAYLRPDFGIIGITNAPTSLKASLEMTTDFVHWYDITPPIPGPDSYGAAYVFTVTSAFKNWRPPMRSRDKKPRASAANV